MPQLRRFTPPSRPDETPAPFGPPNRSRTFNWNGGGATLPRPSEKLSPPPAFAGKARKSAPFAQVAFSSAVAACDVLVIVIAALVADWAYEVVLDNPHVSKATVSAGSAVAAMFVLANSTRGEYRFDHYLQGKGHIGRSMSLWALAFVWLLAIGFITKVSEGYSRAAVTIFFFIGIFAVIGARTCVVRVAQRHVGRGSALSRRVLLVGYAEDIEGFRRRHEDSMLGVDFVGAFPLRRHGRILLDVEVAAGSARVLRADEVFIIVPWSHKKTIDACVDVFRKLPVAIHLGPESIVSRFTHARVTQFGPTQSLELVRPPLSHGEIVAKRAFDLAGASLGLVLLAPVFLLVAILIKLDSPGKVFFTQGRHGFNQEPFRILKFRTMTTADDGPCIVQAQRDDKRITRVGRWLRRFNIDELPQLVNVLRGEMSLVGPRPHARAHDELFERQIEFYARRHNIKPGITGWAQVNGFRGEIRTQEDILRRIEYDLFYLDNWSIWLDCVCIWRTVVSSRAYSNAY